MTGGVVYNAAPGEPAPIPVRALAGQVGMAGRGTVIYELFEGNDLPPLEAVTPNPAELRCRALRRVADAPEACAAFNRLYELGQVNPLRVFAGRAHRSVQNDILLPNHDKQRIIRTRLHNGTEMLFLRLEQEDFGRARDPAPAERYFTWLERRLAMQGQQLLVVLMPSKYTAYAPLLAAPDTAPARSVSYLADLERRLRLRGIEVVNLVDPLRAAARAALRADSLLLWRDETHWNAAGVIVAARAIAPHLTGAAQSRSIARP
jgi:hypothetical protein